MNRHRRVALAFALGAVLLALANVMGCHAILGLDDPTVEALDAAVPIDNVTPEASAADGGLDAEVGDAAADAEPDVVVTYNEDWDNPTLWNSIDLEDVVAGVSSFTGAVFDGRYVYFAPSNNTLQNALAARYDTTGNTFALKSQWEFFDTASLNPNARGFEGAIFDGRYVYFVPFANATEHVGLVTRFDTKAGRAYNDPVAWSTYDLTAINQYAKGFIGAAYDGSRYAYFVPGLGTFDASGRPQAIAARYDTTAPFNSPSSWQMFDTQTADPLGPRGFFGTVFTGTHLYCVPFGYGGGNRGRTIRYDVAKPFTSASSWELFDTTSLDANARGFQGGGFDGRHVYFMPLLNEDLGFHGVVPRYDTLQPFLDAGSWNVQTVGELDGSIAPSPLADGGVIDKVGYAGAGFDGRYFYLVPNNHNGADYHGWIARYDTTEPFDAGSGWSHYDATRIKPNAKGFVGSVFDGQYMYFVPGFKSVVVRFYAKSPARMPKYPSGGSFL